MYFFFIFGSPKSYLKCHFITFWNFGVPKNRGPLGKCLSCLLVKTALVKSQKLRKSWRQVWNEIQLKQVFVLPSISSTLYARFFRTKFWRQTRNVTRKKDVCTKNGRVKLWWNGHLEWRTLIKFFCTGLPVYQLNLFICWNY